MPLWLLPGARGDRPTAAGHSGRQTPNSVLSEVLRVWSFVEEKNLMLPKKTCKILIRSNAINVYSVSPVTSFPLVNSCRPAEFVAWKPQLQPAAELQPGQGLSKGAKRGCDIVPDFVMFLQYISTACYDNSLRNFAVQTVGTSQATRQQGTSHRAAQHVAALQGRGRRAPLQPWSLGGTFPGSDSQCPTMSAYGISIFFDINFGNLDAKWKVLPACYQPSSPALEMLRLHSAHSPQDSRQPSSWKNISSVAVVVIV